MWNYNFLCKPMIYFFIYFWKNVAWLLTKFLSLRNGINLIDLKDYNNEDEHVSNLVIHYL